jgi:hypothetical protein
MRPELHVAIEKELANAENARQNENEGMARVCARRAAGLAAQDFLFRQGVQLRRGSAYDALKLLVSYPGLEPHLQAAAAHLTATVSQEFTLPEEIDLIADAKNLIGGLG